MVLREVFSAVFHGNVYHLDPVECKPCLLSHPQQQFLSCSRVYECDRIAATGILELHNLHRHIPESLQGIFR